MRISAVLMTLCIMAGMCLTGCKETKTTMSSSSSDSTASDTGLSISVDTGSSDSDSSDVPGVSTTLMKMTYEDNYDQAAINEMGKIVKIRDMQFTALDYNFEDEPQRFLQHPDDSVRLPGYGRSADRGHEDQGLHAEDDHFRLPG